MISEAIHEQNARSELSPPLLTGQPPPLRRAELREDDSPLRRLLPGQPLPLGQHGCDYGGLADNERHQAALPLRRAGKQAASKGTSEAWLHPRERTRQLAGGRVDDDTALDCVRPQQQFQREHAA